MELMRSPEELVHLFRARGKKATPQREQIFRVLQYNDSHPTAESIYRELVRDMPSVSLKTVYQTLHELVDMGEITPLDLGTGSSRFDPDHSRHHHLFCRRCHLVKDLHLEIKGLLVPEESAQGFTVESAEIIFRGLCSRCRDGGSYPQENQK